MKRQPSEVRGSTPDRVRPAPGHEAMLLAAYTIGIVLLGVQLWLLTVALELYLGGEGSEVWILAVLSGVVFLGGLFAYRLLGRHPRFSR